MESEGGSKEPQDEPMHPLEERALRSRRPVRNDVAAAVDVAYAHRAPLTAAEMDAIAYGEPYCFRCGKPASSFSEYESQANEYGAASNYVVQEEGTYNPATNRFACDACYIAIGMPAGPGGWVAP